jgi:selenocysteine lyase/cysteine desulfurase
MNGHTPETNGPSDWAKRMRQGMPSSDRWAYLDHAAVAPLPTVAADAMRDWVDDLALNGATGWSHWRDRVEKLRRTAESLMGTDERQIAVIRNTTEGVNLVAEGLDWHPGDNLVVPACEFPSNLYAWQHLADRDVEVRVLPVDLDHVSYDAIEAACDEHTRLVAISWIGFRTGFRIDPGRVAEIAHRHGAWLFVDAIQGLGAFPLDVEAMGIDALAADGHKWLLGPEGAGVFYIRPPLMDRLRPLGLGWNSVRHAGDFSNTDLDLKPHAGRYEGGTYNMAGIAGLEASLGWLDGIGFERIGSNILEITDHLCEKLSVIGARLSSNRTPEHSSGIVSFEMPGQSPRELMRACRDRDVIINCRDGRLRASPHAYSTTDDIDRLIDVLA